MAHDNKRREFSWRCNKILVARRIVDGVSLQIIGGRKCDGPGNGKIFIVHVRVECALNDLQRIALRLQLHDGRRFRG